MREETKSRLARIGALIFCVAFWLAVAMAAKAIAQEPALSPAASQPAVRTVRMKVTAYCPCRICCGKWAEYAKTACGDDARICDGVAADFKLLPKRTLLEIPGVGIKEVDDTGGAMRQDAKRGIYHIDLRFPTHRDALMWGVKWLDVKVYSRTSKN